MVSTLLPVLKDREGPDVRDGQYDGTSVLAPGTTVPSGRSAKGLAKSETLM
jgi:hypothetical protein